MITVIGFASAPISIPLVPELTAARRTRRDDERRLLSSVLALFSPAGAVIWLLREHVHVLPLIVLATVVYLGPALALRDEEARGYARLALSLPASMRRVQLEG